MEDFVQIQHTERDFACFGKDFFIQQKVADIAIPVVQTGKVHFCASLRKTVNDLTLEFFRRWICFPVFAEIFQRDLVLQLVCYDE